MTTNTINFECRDLALKKVIVFTDRAEISRQLQTELAEGTNEVHIQNISQSTVHDSVRVDGTGDAIIHEVLQQDKPALPDQVDTPKVAALREIVKQKEEVVEEIKDKGSVLEKRRDALDTALNQLSGKDKALTVDDDLLAGFDKFNEYYDTQSSALRAEIRKLKATLTKAEEELNKARSDLNIADMEQRGYSKNLVIVLESKNGGPVTLDLVYQVYNSSWTPSYDIRVDVGEKNNMKVSYYAKVSQQTGEDWIDVPLVLSTAQPSLGGHIPELGTLEASFYREPPPQPHNEVRTYACRGGGASFGAVPKMQAVMLESLPMQHADVLCVREQTLSTEFDIARPANIPSNPDSHKVTIGIIDLKPQLVHECVPSKNTSVFLTASAVNQSKLPILRGEASVFLNNAFVTKTHLKNISPNERFSCSLGIDASVRVEYKPVKKYHEQVGLINKSSSVVNEQVINVKNTRSTKILLVVKEHIPRTTDEKLKIRVVHPGLAAHEETATSVDEQPCAPKVGAKLNSKNNLEWTVELNPLQQQDLNVKWVMEHPKEEKVEFNEKY